MGAGAGQGEGRLFRVGRGRIERLQRSPGAPPRDLLAMALLWLSATCLLIPMCPKNAFGPANKYSELRQVDWFSGGCFHPYGGERLAGLFSRGQVFQYRRLGQSICSQGIMHLVRASLHQP